MYRVTLVKFVGDSNEETVINEVPYQVEQWLRFERNYERLGFESVYSEPQEVVVK